MEEKNISEQESLEIITRMIQKTRRNSISHKPYLSFGYLALICTITLNTINYIYNSHRTEIALYSFLAILSTAFGIYGIIKIMQRYKKEGTAISYSDRMHQTIWSAVALAMLIVNFTTFRHIKHIEEMNILLAGTQIAYAFILIFANLLEASAINEKYKIFSNINCIAIGVLTGITPIIFNTDDTYIIIKSTIPLALAIIVALIIPGHKIYKENNNKEA